MTFYLDFDDERNLITVAAIGSANAGARLESLRTLRMDSRFRNEFGILCKFVDNEYVPDGAECLHLGLTLAAFFRGQKIALVVGHAESARLKESIALFNSTARVEISIFNSVSPARGWLSSHLESIDHDLNIAPALLADFATGASQRH